MYFVRPERIVQAVRLVFSGIDQDADWFWDAVKNDKIVTHNFGEQDSSPASATIHTKYGKVPVKPGEYIVKYASGDIAPCTPCVFNALYVNLEDLICQTS